ncbi:unnamed protein product [Dovyalis caffra]|uniref:Uncharacterized protein n=1 Tax=Dovyalis caffra TaxID=77055 RepID=A0AAV1QTW7_9ROSI|nr:unnamed protein product [Dovyalis caffra]
MGYPLWFGSFAPFSSSVFRLLCRMADHLSYFGRGGLHLHTSTHGETRERVYSQMYAYYHIHSEINFSKCPFMTLKNNFTKAPPLSPYLQSNPTHFSSMTESRTQTHCVDARQTTNDPTKYNPGPQLNTPKCIRGLLKGKNMPNNNNLKRNGTNDGQLGPFGGFFNHMVIGRQTFN